MKLGAGRSLPGVLVAIVLLCYTCELDALQDTPSTSNTFGMSIQEKHDGGLNYDLYHAENEAVAGGNTTNPMGVNLLAQDRGSRGHDGRRQRRAGTEQEKRIKLVNDEGLGYYRAEVFIGGPFRKAYKLRVTTGTSAAWVFGKRAKKQLKNDGFEHTYYVSKESRTNKEYLKPDKKFFVEYTSGATYSGEMVYESAMLGGIKIHEIEMAVVNKVGHESVTNFDGMLGLGVTAKKWVENKAVISPFLRLVKKKKKHQFSFYLSKDNVNGWLTFGGDTMDAGSDEDLYHADTMVVLPMLKGEPGWSLSLDAVKYIIGEQINYVMSTSPVKMEVDIGCEVMLAPRSVIQKMVDLTDGLRWLSEEEEEGVARVEAEEGRWPELGGAEEHTVVLDDCSRLDKMPIIEFKFGKEKLELKPAEYFVEEPVASSQKKSETTRCRLLIMPSSELSEHRSTYDWVLGGPVLKKYYSLFDYKRKQISFALAK